MPRSLSYLLFPGTSVHTGILRVHTPGLKRVEGVQPIVGELKAN